MIAFDNRDSRQTTATDPNFDPFGVNLITPHEALYYNYRPEVFFVQVTLHGPPCSGTNWIPEESPAEGRRRSLGYKKWLSWCNMLDRMDEQRHARGHELLRLPDSKALAPKRRAPSVGRVCSGSSRYRVMSPCG